MIDSSRDDDHVVLNDFDPDPFVVPRIADVEVSGTFDDQSDLIVRVDVLLEKLMELRADKKTCSYFMSWIPGGNTLNTKKPQVCHQCWPVLRPGHYVLSGFRLILVLYNTIIESCNSED